MDLTLKMTPNQLIPIPSENSPENKSWPVFNNKVNKALWLSVSEAAKLGGVQTKTIRRAIQFNYVIYKIIGNRYLVDFPTLISYLHAKTKLKNKLNQYGLGQYVDKWKHIFYKKN